MDGGNLMAVLLVRGRFAEVEELASNLLRDDRPPFIPSRLQWLHTLQGDLVTSRESLSKLDEWKGSGPEPRGMRIALS